MPMTCKLRELMRTAFAIVVFAAMAFGQSETGKTALSGRVLDPTGKAVQSAVIGLIETQMGQQRKVSSDADGKFRFVSLPVGTYDIEAVATGFAISRATKVELLVGEAKSITIGLSLASISTAVTVDANVEIVN